MDPTASIPRPHRRQARATPLLLTLVAGVLLALALWLAGWLVGQRLNSTLGQGDTVEMRSATWLAAGSQAPSFISRPNVLKVVLRLSRSDGGALTGTQGVLLYQRAPGQVLDWGSMEQVEPGPASGGYADYVLYCDPAIPSSGPVQLSVVGCRPLPDRPWWVRFIPGYTAPAPLRLAGSGRLTGYPLRNDRLEVPAPPRAAAGGRRGAGSNRKTPSPRR